MEEAIPGIGRVADAPLAGDFAGDFAFLEVPLGDAGFGEVFLEVRGDFFVEAEQEGLFVAAGGAGSVFDWK